jgi:hypothetical protein
MSNISRLIGRLVLLVLASALKWGSTRARRDWFNSRFISFFTAITVFSSVAFFMRGWNNPKNIVDLSLLKGSQLPRRPVRHHRLWRDLVRHHALAAAHPRLWAIRHERRHAVHSAGGSKRHRAIHHRQLPHAVDRLRIPVAAGVVLQPSAP